MTRPAFAAVACPAVAESRRGWQRHVVAPRSGQWTCFPPPESPNDRRERFNEDVATGFIGIYSFELLFRESHSLKEKRMHLRSVKAQLTRRVACSIAEVDHHDVWQRTRLTLACVTREAGEAHRLLDEAERWLAGQDFDLIAHERDLVTLDD